MKVFQGGLKSMEINVQWKLRKDFSTFKFHVKKDGVKKLELNASRRRLRTRPKISHESD